MTFATWFRQQLQRREMTQTEFARKANLGTSTVSFWANGRRTPDPVSCDIISDILRIDLDTVLAAAGHRPAIDPLPPGDFRREVAALADRVTWTPDRKAYIRSLLQSMIDLDEGKAK